MLRYFLDTSALIKLYHEEEGTEVVDNLVSQNQPVIVISDLSGLEMVSAMSRKVRAQEIKPETFTAVLIALDLLVAADKRLTAVAEQESLPTLFI
jgi:predicted nucleic acid-binding protein